MSWIGFLNVRKAFLLFLTQSFSQLVFSNPKELWCSEHWNQEKSFQLVDGRNFSLRLPRFETPPLDTQWLVWTKGESTWKKRYNGNLEFTGGNVSFDVTRYELIEDNNGSLNIFISFIESDDMGRHIIAIHDDVQYLCTVYIINLTIESTEPYCSTFFLKERNTLQMSCQWIQVMEGEQAQLVAAGSRVLYEHSSSKVNFDGQCNVTNNIHIYVDLQDIWNERLVPDTCAISHPKRREAKTCHFPVNFLNTPQYDVTKTAMFGCCSDNKNISLSWWYNDNDDLIFLNSSKAISQTIATGIVFLCGEVENISNSLSFRSIGGLKLGRYRFYDISVPRVYTLDINHSSYSTEDKQCHNISVNISSNRSKSRTSTEVPASTQVLVSGSMMTHSTTKESENSCRSYTVPLAVVSAFAFSFVICVCFNKSRGFTRCRVKTHRGIEMNSSTAVGNDATESDQMTRESAARPNTMTNTVATEHHVTDNVPFCQEDSVHSRGASHLTAISTKPHQNSTYCSLDDVEDIPFDTKRAATPSTSTRLPLSLQSRDRQTDHSRSYHISTDTEQCILPVEPEEGKQHPFMANTPGPSIKVDELYAKPAMFMKTRRIAALESDYDDPRGPSDVSPKTSGPKNCFDSSVTQERRHYPLMANTPGSTINVDELYAKPDMSRKTRKIDAQESVYDDPRVPGDDFYRKASNLRSPSVNATNNNQLYSNVDAPTDESTCDSELYMNASDNRPF